MTIPSSNLIMICKTSHEKSELILIHRRTSVRMSETKILFTIIMFYCHHIKQNLKVHQFFIFSRTTEENSFIALGKLNEPPTYSGGCSRIQKIKRKSKYHCLNCKQGISVFLHVLLNYLLKYALLPPQHP